MVPEVFIQVVEEFKTKYTITTICECLKVPKSTYYRWKNKAWGPSDLETLIIQICESLSFRVGHRMVKKLLDRDHQIKLNRNTVQKIMQKYSLQCQVKKKRQKYISGESKIVVPNLLNRDFKAERPNQKGGDRYYLPALWREDVIFVYNHGFI